MSLSPADLLSAAMAELNRRRNRKLTADERSAIARLGGLARAAKRRKKDQPPSTG